MSDLHYGNTFSLSGWMVWPVKSDSSGYSSGISWIACCNDCGHRIHDMPNKAEAEHAISVHWKNCEVANASR